MFEIYYAGMPRDCLFKGRIKMSFKNSLNTENGGFTPDKSRGPKAPRNLSGVKPTFEVFNRLKTRSRRFC